jgi:DNA-binding NtrC family response regulator
LRALPPVLVVDDDETLCQVMAEGLRHAGYNARTAGNGMDALFALEAQEPALLILDLRMPLVDGWELVEELKMWDVKVPIVVVSGATPDVAATAQQIGAVDFLRKPFDLRDLIDKVDRVVLSGGTQFPSW